MGLIFLKCHGQRVCGPNWSLLTVLQTVIALGCDDVSMQLEDFFIPEQYTVHHSGDRGGRQRKKYIPLQDKITFSSRKSEK